MANQTIIDGFDGVSVTLSDFVSTKAEKKYIFEEMYCCVLTKNCNIKFGVWDIIYYSMIILSYISMIILSAIGMLSSDRSELFNTCTFAGIGVFAFNVLLLVSQRLGFIRYLSDSYDHYNSYSYDAVWTYVFYSINTLFMFICMMINLGFRNQPSGYYYHYTQSQLDGTLLFLITLTIGNIILWVFYFVFPRYNHFTDQNNSIIYRFIQDKLCNFEQYISSIFAIAIVYGLFSDILFSFGKGNNETLFKIAFLLLCGMCIVSLCVGGCLLLIVWYFEGSPLPGRTFAYGNDFQYAIIITIGVLYYGIAGFAKNTCIFFTIV
jgi:hypothetical protein